jgi:hypothetical protein
LGVCEVQDWNNKENRMPGKIKTVRGLLVAMLALPLALAACGTAQTAPTATPPIVYITQVVTQIIPPTPVPMTPTTPPTETPVPPSPTPTWDPLSAPIYYPIEGCVASRLHVGDKAMVSYVGGANGIRYDRDLSQEGVFAYAQPGAVLDIVNGPWCSQGWIVWFVRTGDGVEGFTPEGDGNEYFLLPTAP